MMSNYVLIKRKRELEKFIESLPETELHENHLIMLFARKKYSDVVMGDNEILRQSIVRDKKFIYERIKQWECPIGGYTNRKGSILPQESLALYIGVNTCNINRVKVKLAHRLIDSIYTDSNNSITAMLYSEAQKNFSKSRFVDFDFDIPKDSKIDIEEYKYILHQHINKNAYKILLTRGGFHLIVDVEKVAQEFKKTWYKNLNSISDGKKDLMPIPGCSQGGFVPKFIK